MKFDFKTQGVCSRRIVLDIEDGKLLSVEFEGGCNGNLKGIGELCKGMDVKEVVARLEGIRCGFKPTSCPDQLAQALKIYIEKSEKGEI